MLSKRPSINIDHIESMHIQYPFHPLLEDIIIDHLKGHENKDSLIPMKKYEYDEINKSKIMSSIDLIGKIMSVLSGLAIIIFVFLLLLGHTAIGTVQVSTLLTIISFTLVGGIISIGGVQMFSLNASLRKAENKVENIFNKADNCPFVGIVVEPRNSNWENYIPGNPRFCVKCPLGIDTVSDDRGGLIHVCKIYPSLYSEWSNRYQNEV